MSEEEIEEMEKYIIDTIRDIDERTARAKAPLYDKLIHLRQFKRPDPIYLTKDQIDLIKNLNNN